MNCGRSGQRRRRIVERTLVARSVTNPVILYLYSSKDERFLFISFHLFNLSRFRLSRISSRPASQDYRTDAPKSVSIQSASVASLTEVRPRTDRSRRFASVTHPSSTGPLALISAVRRSIGVLAKQPRYSQMEFAPVLAGRENRNCCTEGPRRGPAHHR